MPVRSGRQRVADCRYHLLTAEYTAAGDRLPAARDAPHKHPKRTTYITHHATA